jgi:hypothetical protein
MHRPPPLPRRRRSAGAPAALPIFRPACSAPAREAGTIKCLRLHVSYGVEAAMRMAIEAKLDELRSRNTRRLGALLHVDGTIYPRCVKVTEQEMLAIDITRGQSHDECNYTISPNQQPP